jgi:hypothetical protein
MHVLERSLHRAAHQDPISRKYQLFVSLTRCPRLSINLSIQIDRLNLEGYANLEHWVAELDKRIEGIFLQRLRHIIDVWCSEFDRADDGERRDATTTTKRRGERRKDEKVS